MGKKEIKVRCWDKRNNLYTQYSTDFINVYDFIVTGAYYIELEQFTGATDKNGTEIYEGDIITITDIKDDIVDIGEIIFAHYCWMIKFKDKPKFIGFEYLNEFVDTSCYDIEVIGNIHFKNLEL